MVLITVQTICTNGGHNIRKQEKQNNSVRSCKKTSHKTHSNTLKLFITYVTLRYIFNRAEVFAINILDTTFKIVGVKLVHFPLHCHTFSIIEL